MVILKTVVISLTLLSSLAYAQAPQGQLAGSPLNSFEKIAQDTICDSKDNSLQNQKKCFDVLKEFRSSWLPFTYFMDSPLQNLKTLARAGQAICSDISADSEKRACFHNAGIAFDKVRAVYYEVYQNMRTQALTGNKVHSDQMDKLEYVANIAELEHQRITQLESEGQYMRLYGELSLSADSDFSF